MSANSDDLLASRVTKFLTQKVYEEFLRDNPVIAAMDEKKNTLTKCLVYLQKVRPSLETSDRSDNFLSISSQVTDLAISNIETDIEALNKQIEKSLKEFQFVVGYIENSSKTVEQLLSGSAQSNNS